MLLLPHQTISMKYKTSEWLDQLTKEVNDISTQFGALLQYPGSVLSAPPAPGKWSAIQVIEHLNSYNRYYLHHIGQSLDASHPAPAASFSQGLLGGYFTRMMYSQVKSGGQITNKMQAPKDHTPVANLNVQAVLDEFAAGQLKLQQLLGTARRYDLGSVKVPISISKFIKLKLGDTFGFLVAHQVRHFQQIENTLNAINLKQRQAA